MSVGPSFACILIGFAVLKLLFYRGGLSDSIVGRRIEFKHSVFINLFK